jgi:hypothetical protein
MLSNWIADYGQTTFHLRQLIGNSQTLTRPQFPQTRAKTSIHRWMWELVTSPQPSAGKGAGSSRLEQDWSTFPSGPRLTNPHYKRERIGMGVAP